jgi:heme-degrading monooxygenase HmoA
MPRYPVLGLLKLKPGSRPAAEQIADQGAPALARQPGFERVVFFVDEVSNNYGAVSFWDSREAAEQAFGDLLVGPIESRIYEIYEHKQ